VIYGFNASEVFQIAIDIEENGRRFYEKAMGLSDDHDVNTVFAALAQEEAEHLEKFKDLKSQLPKAASGDTVWDPENEVDQYLQMMADMNVFRSDVDMEERLSLVGSVEDALKLGIQFEKDSIIFFLSMQEATAENKGRKSIDQLVNEEKEHLKRLSLELRRHRACRR
jgi:rubrerythrin